MSQLQQLIGKRLKNLTHEVSYVIPLPSELAPTGKEEFDLYLQMSFDDYTLNIYNNHILDNLLSIEDLVGEVLSKIDETDSEISFHFGDKSVKVDMSDQGYTGPEALCLYGPNDLVVVWN